jgi:hypothetical protein
MTAEPNDSQRRFTEALQSGAPPELDRGRLSRLLGLGMARAVEPADRLARRLSRPDGAAWLERQLASGALSQSSAVLARLASGGASLDELRELKARANQQLEEGSDTAWSDARLGSLAAYFLAVASALAHHGANITRQPPEKLAPLLERLAGAAPTAWRTLLEAAVVRLRQL